MYQSTYDDYDYDDYSGHAGDPMTDRDYERRMSMGSYVPEPVRKFLVYFHNAIAESSGGRNTFEVTKLYEQTFPKLTEEYFKTSPWPDAEEISGLVHDDELFLILYKELYFRHIYARVPGGPTVEQRFDSYQNYCDLFNLILSPTTPVELDLPNQWLWEIVDEFIYQFQSFQQFMSKPQRKAKEDIEFYRQSPRTWDVLQVLNVLQFIVDKSNINEQLRVYAQGGNPDSVAGEFGRVPLYKMLGFFSLVGLLRLHSLLGDYYLAIKALENIELNKKSLHSRVPGCQITMYYYVGFAYMMMRRYSDAIRTFSSILVYIQRTKSMFQTKTYQNDQINKQTEQMFVLLSICLVLHPKRIDESLQSVLKDNYYLEKINKMQAGDLDEFEACFIFACPKFLSPVSPPLDPADGSMTLGGSNETSLKESLRLQVEVFKDEVKQQMKLPICRSYLKLYTSMSLDKLATYMGFSVDELENVLLCYKHKMMNLVWTKGTSALEGEFQCESEVDFYIDKNMVHIADTKVDPKYGDHFIRQILKFEELNRSLKTMQM